MDRPDGRKMGLSRDVVLDPKLCFALSRSTFRLLSRWAA